MRRIFLMLKSSVLTREVSKLFIDLIMLQVEKIKRVWLLLFLR